MKFNFGWHFVLLATASSSLLLSLPTLVTGESRGALFCEDDSSIDTEHGKRGPDGTRSGAIRCCYSVSPPPEPEPDEDELEELEGDDPGSRKKRDLSFIWDRDSTTTSISLDDECIVNDIESEDSFDDYRRFNFAKFYQIHCDGERMGLCEYREEEIEDPVTGEVIEVISYWIVQEKCRRGAEGVCMIVDDDNRRNLRGHDHRKMLDGYEDPDGTITVEIDGKMWNILP